MTTLKRAILKSYSPASHSAAVQVAGSLAVWLDGIPVSVAIPPSECVAGRECGVLFFTDDNPTDAAVITVHNAVASPSPFHRISDADADTHIDVETTADEDKVRVTVLGTLRYLVQDASPQHQLTGDVQASSNLALAGSTIASGKVILFDKTLGDAGGLDGIAGTVRQSGAGATRGVTGDAQVNSGNTNNISYLRGLEFRANHLGSGVVTDQIGALAMVQGSGPSTNRVALFGQNARLIATATKQIGVLSSLSSSGTGAITVPDYHAFKSEASVFQATITTFYHYAIADATLVLGAAVTTLYGFYNPGIAAGSFRRPFWDAGIAGNVDDRSGNRFRSNTALFTVATSTTGAMFGAGDGVLYWADATTAPGATAVQAGGLRIYAAAGDLLLEGPSGNIVTLPANAPPSVTGAKGGNAALTSLLTQLAALGLIVDNTT